MAMLSCFLSSGRVKLLKGVLRPQLPADGLQFLPPHPHLSKTPLLPTILDRPKAEWMPCCAGAPQDLQSRFLVLHSLHTQSLGAGLAYGPGLMVLLAQHCSLCVWFFCFHLFFVFLFFNSLLLIL